MGSWQGVFRAIQIARGKLRFPLSFLSPFLLSATEILADLFILPAPVLDLVQRAASTVFTNPTAGTDNADTSTSEQGDAAEESDDDLYNYGPAPTSKPALIDTMVRIPIDLDGAIARSKDENAADTSASASVST